MNCPQNLFRSPEYYPLRVDFEKHLISFVRMSRETYRESVFLDFRTRYLGDSPRNLRLDDVLLVAANTASDPHNVNYILHPAFCCSTLLARYFELLPSCFVLKEPLLLTQLAISSGRGARDWEETFALSTRLLTRTYDREQTVVIKVHEPCNSLGLRLLKQNKNAAIAFLTTPLRHFILSVMKSSERRNWIRKRVAAGLQHGASLPGLEDVRPSNLTDAQAAACMWTVNSFLCEELASGSERSRVFVLHSEQLLDFPHETLRDLFRFFKMPPDENQIAWMVEHPSMHKYSKDVSRSYDAISRRREIAELEGRFGHEADLGTKWAACHSVTPLTVL